MGCFENLNITDFHILYFSLYYASFVPMIFLLINVCVFFLAILFL